MSAQTHTQKKAIKRSKAKHNTAKQTNTRAHSQHSEARQTESIRTKTSAINKIYCERESVFIDECLHDVLVLRAQIMSFPNLEILRDLWVKAIVYVHRVLAL